MSEKSGKNFNVCLDVMANAVIVDLAGEQDLQTEEVIRHLGSDALLARTRDRLYVDDIVRRVRETGIRLLIPLRSVWEYWMELDIEAALSALFDREPVRA